MATKTSWNELDDADFYDATGDAYDDDRLYEEGDDIALRPPPDLRPARLLLAEEDDDLRRSIAQEMRGKGYEVDEAFSGFEAIALLARQAGTYDLVITDMDLKGMNGLELVDELRASPQHADSEIPVIMLGDPPSDDIAREVERLHAVVVEKPCDIEKLWQRAASMARPVQIERHLH
jgi:CheY-like chemotaxis protein